MHEYNKLRAHVHSLYIQTYGEYEISLYLGHPVSHVMMQKQLYECRNVGDGERSL